MTSKDNIILLCRLCLEKDNVNVPIFGETGEAVEQVQMKINTCLPVTITKVDDLPKNICVNCANKLDLFYQFWNDSIEAEKQLTLWISNGSVDQVSTDNMKPGQLSNIQESGNINNETRVKEEAVDTDDEISSSRLKNSGCDTSTDNLKLRSPRPKRSRRAANIRQIIQSLKESDEDDLKETKTDKEWDDSDIEDDVSFPDPSSRTPIDKPSTSTEEVPPIFPSTPPTREDHLVPIVQLSEGSWLHNEDITSPFAAQIHETLKKLGYKNPFVYPKLKHKKKQLKQLESRNNTKWQCMICSEVKKNKDDLMEHYEIHKSETESLKGSKMVGDYFMCPVCLTDFTSLISYERHVELNHGEKQYNCEVCHRAFKNLFSLSVHNNKRHSLEKVYRCAACDFEDEELKELRCHVRNSHEDNVKYRCEICNKGFSSFSWYQEHKNFHTGAMPFECEVCSKSFPYTRYLIAHKKNMHPEMFSNVPINHECEICQKKFAHKKSLVLHLRGHTGESAVLCDMCGKSLSSSEHLKQHLRIHTGYKPHCCSVCGKGFAKKCNLTLHERVHSGEKPHVCNICNKGFSQRSTLVIHGRYHSGERPYRCQLCQKGFVAKGLLGVHMKTCGGIPE
ncbi:zinc finger protein 583-like isoform X2 [Coccinella septempunctata]|uniref:zinc finger protein 583-like isoform X2 n=1 Tax=Coccinella septempunctata TaxID=41139 RepID=UPI001D06C282|nr:zinc finger protein 583-like isoform X2 [Coccinella septempunctata]